MKKRLLLGVLYGVFLGTALMAQVLPPPGIQWQRSFGGTNWDEALSVRLTGDGGYVVGGSSTSPPGGNKISPSFGNFDYWVMRLDGAGNKLWEQSFGGDRLDILSDMAALPDGGFLLSGFSQSGVSGNKTSPAFGSRDFWLVRIDASGTKMWERSYGTTNMETLRSIQRLPDGGFVMAGHIQYLSSMANPNQADWWIVRVDAGGDQVWQRTIGGSSLDQVPFVRLMPNGDLCLAGQSTSPISGDKTSGGSQTPSEDYWLVRLNQAGNKLWDKTFWGNSYDYLSGLETTVDGGLLLGGMSSSWPSGNKTSPYFGEWSGFGDYWVVRVDGNGSKVWEKSFGGSGGEIFGQGIQIADGGFILGGDSGSLPSGNKTSALYGTGGMGGDFWVVRLNEDGETLWEDSYEGSGSDGLTALSQTPDGGFILVGNSSSPSDGRKTVPAHGNGDVWIVKISADARSTPPRLKIPPQTSQSISTSGSRLVIEGVSNQNYVVEYSLGPETWLPLTTNRLIGSSMELMDSGATNLLQRFYRVRVVP